MEKNTNDIIVDAGANQGGFSLNIAQRNPDLLTYAIEPEPELANRLEKEAANRGLSNHRALRFAVADKDGTATFHVSHTGDWGTSSLLEFDQSHLTQDEYWSKRPDLNHSFEIKVETKRLETFLDSIAYSEIAFMKIDVQGLDLEALQSMGRHLPRLQAGMLEVVATRKRALYQNETATLLDALNFLNTNGFDVYAIKPNDHAANEFNIFFVRRDLSYESIEKRLSLLNLPMYDGKHFWHLPSDHLGHSDAFEAMSAELARLHSEIERLSAEISRLNLEYAKRVSENEAKHQVVEHFEGMKKRKIFRLASAIAGTLGRPL